MNVLLPLLPSLLLGAFDISAPATLSDRDAAPVVVVNRSTREITVRLNASGFSAAGSDGGVIQNPIVLQWEAGPGADGGRSSVSGSSLTLRLAAGEVAYVKAMLNPDLPGGVPAGFESAHLVAYEEGVDSVASQEIQLPVLAPPTHVKPAVPSWDLSMTCGPWSRCAEEALLPVAVDTSTKGPLVLSTGVLARLYNPRGDMANVLVEDGSPDEVITASSTKFFETRDGTVSLRTHVASLDTAGVYTGKLKLGGDEIDVKLNVSHPWGYMIVMTILGALVFLGQRSLGLYRGVASFNARAGSLQKKLGTARKTFADKVQHIPGASAYDIQADVEARIKQGKQEIAAEMARAKEPIDEAESEAFQQLAQVEEVVEAWPGFADRLVNLKTRVDAITGQAAKDERFARTRKAPTSVVRAQELLKGVALTVDGFPQRGKQVDDSLDTLDRWEALDTQVSGLETQRQKLQARAEESTEGTRMQATLDKAGEDLKTLSEDLWIQELQAGPQDLGSRVTLVKVALDRAELQLENKAAPLMTLEALPLAPFSQPGVQMAMRTGGGTRPLTVPLGFWGNLRYFLWKLSLWLKSVAVTDGLLILIALALASFFQLESTYLSHAWGEPKDYIAAFIAGYGSQGLVSILDAIAGRQLASKLQSIVKR